MALPEYWLRASSLSELFDCPARWAAKHIEKKTMPRSAVSHIGTCLHASTASFDKSYINKFGLTAHDTLSIYIDGLYDKNADVEWKDDDISKDKAERIGSMLHERYCETITPQQGYTKVEVECKPMVITFDDIGVQLKITGSTDRVRMTDKGLGISDLKSGKTAVKADGTVDTAKHGAQLGIYELLVENETGIPIEAPAQIVGMQTIEKARVGTGEIKSAKELLIGKDGQAGMLEQAASLIKSGNFFGNNRSMMCHEKFCPSYKTCNFRF